MPDIITLDVLARQQATTLAHLADMRADRLNDRANHTALLDLIHRLDTSVQGLTNEVRALHGQIGRFTNRLQRLEDKAHD